MSDGTTRDECAFKGVLFDWKGTLEPKTPKTETGERPDKKERLDSAVAAIHQELEQAGFGGSFRDEHDRVMSSAGLTNKGKLVQTSLDNLRVSQSDPDLARRLEELYLETIRGPTAERALYPGAVELLKKLKEKGVPVALVRNSRLPRETFMRNLEEAGVSHLFDAVVMSGDVGHEKPAAPIFRHAVSSLGLDHVHTTEPHTLIFIGNETEADVKGANAMGWKSCLLTSTEATSHGHAHYEVNSMHQLHDILFPSSSSSSSSLSSSSTSSSTSSSASSPSPSPSGLSPFLNPPIPPSGPLSSDQVIPIPSTSSSSPSSQTQECETIQIPSST